MLDNNSAGMSAGHDSSSTLILTTYVVLHMIRYSFIIYLPCIKFIVLIIRLGVFNYSIKISVPS